MENENHISISCKCLTYGRVDLLEESIYSFINQNYQGESEMLIVNDYPLQTLYFDHPKVRIINLKETFRLIGEKEEFSINECKFDTIAQWDDDDCAMPWHLNNINKFFPGHNLLHWNTGVFMMGYKIEKIMSLGNSGIVFSKEAWRKVGGYPKENAGADMTFVVKIQRELGNVCRATMDLSKASWMYRWGLPNYNLSGLGSDKNRPEDEQIIARHTRHIEKLRKEGKIPTGDIELKPYWNKDYVSMLKDYING